MISKSRYSNLLNMSIDQLKPLSHAGDLQARFNLAVHYYHADDETQDYEEAVRLLKPLAERGNSDAQYLLGEMYEYGFGVEQNINEALRLYRLSAENGNPSGQCAFANSYDGTVGSPEGTENGGIVKNNREAYYWYLLALGKNPDERLTTFLNNAINRLTNILSHGEIDKIEEMVKSSKDQEI